MNGQAYAAARTVAPKVHAYFARHLAEARERGISPLASLPDEDEIGSMIDAAFWTSLRREEGYVPRISLAFLSPAEADHPLTLDRPLPLSAAALTRVAPAVERAGIHLGVARVNGGELAVWGTTRGIPALCLVLEVTAPGLLVIKHHRGDESGKYINVAVLEGDQIKLVDERASLLPDCPKVLPTLLGFESPTSASTRRNVLVQLAVSMRATGRGGALLVVPPNTESWRESIVWPALYARVAGVLGTADAEPDAARGRTRALHLAGGARARGERDGRADGRRRRHGDHVAIRTARVRRDHRAAQGIRAGRTGGGHRADRRRRGRPRAFRSSWEARGISTARSSCTISAIRWRSWRRATGDSRSSRGRQSSRWCTPIASRRCFSSRRCSSRDSLLLAAQRDRRIDPRGAPRRNPAGEQRDRRQQQRNRR